jgi:hypothetical protein
VYFFPEKSNHNSEIIFREKLGFLKLFKRLLLVLLLLMGYRGVGDELGAGHGCPIEGR